MSSDLDALLAHARRLWPGRRLVVTMGTGPVDPGLDADEVTVTLKVFDPTSAGGEWDGYFPARARSAEVAVSSLRLRLIALEGRRVAAIAVARPQGEA